MDIITKEFETYLRGYVKAVKKKRNEKRTALQRIKSD